jgi:hypothetical protein
VAASTGRGRSWPVPPASYGPTATARGCRCASGSSTI